MNSLRGLSNSQRAAISGAVQELAQHGGRIFTTVEGPYTTWNGSQSECRVNVRIIRPDGARLSFAPLYTRTYSSARRIANALESLNTSEVAQ